MAGQPIPHSAIRRHGVMVLGQLLGWCRLRASISINVASDIPSLYKGSDRAEIIWLPRDEDALIVSCLTHERIDVLDAFDLATMTGMRRADLVGVTLDEIGPHAIVRTARKKSRGRRRRAVIPLFPELRALIAQLRLRARQPGVQTLLVDQRGMAWVEETLTQAFGDMRNAANEGAGIKHRGEDGVKRNKHLHDCRGTFVTKPCRAGLSDREIADIAAWSPESVSTIRRTYVDDAAVVVALSERIQRVV